MIRRSTALILTLAILASILPLPVTASAQGTGDPEVVSARDMNWQGISLAAGDNMFYVQFKGRNLSNLNAAVCSYVYDDSAGNPVYASEATQLEKRFMGRTIEENEWYVSKMSMNSDKTLEEGKTYYVRLWDGQDTYYDDLYRSNYFYVEQQPYYQSVSAEQPPEISGRAESLALRARAYGFAQGLSSKDFQVELVHTEGMNWGSGEEQEVPKTAPLVVGTMTGTQANAVEDGGYLLEGKVVMNESLSGGQTLFVRVTGKSAHGSETRPNRMKYSMSPIRVVGGSAVAVGQFNIANSVAIRSSQGGDHHHGPLFGTPYMKADGKTTFALGANDPFAYFELTGANIGDATKLSATLAGTSVALSDTSVTGPICGIYTLSGKIALQPSSAGQLVFSYENAVLYQTGISRLSGAGELGATNCSIRGASSYEMPALPAHGILEADLGYPLNLECGKSNFTAHAQKSSGGPKIPLSVNEVLSRGRLMLKMETPEDLSGRYQIHVFYRGTLLPMCSYNGYDEQMTYSVYAPEYNDVLFGSQAAGVHLSGIDNNDGSLLLSGNGFSETVSYTAHFVPRGGTSLAPQELSAGAKYQSAYFLTISQEALKAVPLGWYTVYLTADSTLLTGCADTALIPVSGALTPPTAEIDCGNYTTTRAVPLKITFGSYSKVKIAESADALAGAPWQQTAPASYELSQGYGQKTLYFLFSTDDGSTVTLNDTVHYRIAGLAAFNEFGVAGAPKAGDSFIISKGLSYTLFFTHKEANLTGTVEFKKSDGAVFRTETLYRTSGKDGIYTYSKSVRFGPGFEDVTLVAFSASDPDRFSTPVAEIPLTVSEESVIRHKNTSFDIEYIGGKSYVVAGSAVRYSLQGTPEFGAVAALAYKTSGGTILTTECALAESSPGVYRATAPVPAEAVRIESVTYTISDPNYAPNRVSQSETYETPVTAAAVFTGLDNRDGKYNGMYLSVYSENPWTYNGVMVSGGQGEFAFPSLVPDTQYLYSLEGRGRNYAYGTVSPAAGRTSTFPFSEVKKPASVTFVTEGGTLDAGAFVHYSPTGQDSWSYGNYVSPGVESDGFYIGQETKYTLYLSMDDMRKYAVPAESTFVVGSASHTETVRLLPIPMATVRGTVSDAKVSDRVIEGVNVSATQKVTNGPCVFWHSASATTDAQGRYEIPLYLGAKADLGFDRSGYRSSVEEFTPASDNLTHNASLTYSTNNSVKVTLYVLPLARRGEPKEDLSPVVSDAAEIYLRSTTGVSGGASYNSYTSKVTLYGDSQENGGKSIGLCFGSARLITPDNCSVALDAYANGSVRVVSTQKGVVAAKIPSGGNTPPTAYMMVFDARGHRVGDVITGTDRLSTEQLYLNEGTYTVVFVRGYALSRLGNFRTLAEFEALGIPDNTYCAKRTAMVENGVLTDLGDIEIPEIVANSMLGAFDVRFTAEYTPDNKTGEVRVVARISPSEVRWDREILLNSIHWNSWQCEIPGARSFIDGRRAPNNLFDLDDNEKKVLDHTVLYTIIPQEDQMSVVAEVFVFYTMDKQTFVDSFRETIPASRLSFTAPEHVVQGEKARAVPLEGLAPKGASVEIYDGQQRVGVAVADKKNRYSLKAALTRPDEPGIRILTAKMTLGDTEYSSQEQTVEVVSRTSSAYASDIRFLHYPHGYYSAHSLKTEFYLDDPDNVNFSSNRFYNPYMETTITFRVNNLLKDQVDSASLVKTYRGAEYQFPAQWVQDVTVGGVYSEWKVAEVMGYIDDLYVQYTLKRVDDLALFTGATRPDFERATGKKADPAEAPPAIRDGSNLTVTENTPTSYAMSMDLQGGGTLDYKASFTAKSGMTAERLGELGYRRIDTQQGSYWVYESVTQTPGLGGTVNCQMLRRMYFDQALTGILNPPAPKSIIGMSGYSIAMGPGYLVSAAPDNIVPMSSGRSGTDTALSCVEMTGNLQNAGEIVYEGLKGAPANLGRFGTAMNAVGGVALAVNIFRGRTTKDAQTLYNALNLVESQAVQAAIRREIQDYSQLTVRHYAISNVFNGVGCVSGYAGPLGKGLSIITSLGGGWYNDSTGGELNSMWDSIMRSILAELELQDLRAAKKEKQKKVKWFLDPSGYVFEAIDSNRVSGIEAGVYSGGSEDGAFLLWSGAEESNQKNPQTTDSDGRYGWDVPQGYWKVKFAGDGYLPAESKAMEVDPIHDKVNIGLLATRAPSISSAALAVDGLEIEFDVFMQESSIYDSASGVMNVEVLDSQGNPVPLGPVQFLISAENTAYKKDMTYQKDVVYAERFVKRIRLAADDVQYPGGFRTFQADGGTRETYRAVIGQNAKSYSGVKPASALDTGALTVNARATAVIPEANVPEGSYATPRMVSLSTTTAGATLYYTLDGSQPTVLSRAYGGSPIRIDKTCVLRAFASKAGMNDSETVTLRYFIGKDAPSIVATPTASVAPGTYSSPQRVELRSATEGAAIYYTTDGTRPSSSAALYASAIAVTKSLTIRAIAVKSGSVDSGIASLTYTITEGGASSGEDSSKGDVKPGVPVTVGSDGGETVIKLSISAAASGGRASAGMSSNEVRALAAKAEKEGASGGRIEVGIRAEGSVSQVSLSVPAASFEDIAKTGLAFGFTSSFASIVFDSQAVQTIAGRTGAGDAVISASAVPLSSLSEADRARVADRPVYDLTVVSGGNRVSDLGGGTASVRIPYELRPGEDPGAVVVWHLKDDGTIETVRGRFDSQTGTVVFRTGHFSKFAIASNPVSFKDIPESAWYRPAVSFIAARGITKGTSGTEFSPEADITRGQFAVMLMRGLGIAADSPAADNFSDAGDTYYTGYLAAAKRRGIASGVGSNQFKPENRITRQEMFVMLHNALRAIAELPAPTSAKALADFADGTAVAKWAKDAVSVLVRSGLVSGSAGKLEPEGAATRAEMAQMMYNLLSR